MPGTNSNRWSDAQRQGRDITALMRDINKLEGFQADQTLETALTPQYGVIIGSGSTLTQPQYCDTDSSGNIFVSDASRKKILKFTAAGNYVSEFGTSGSGAGEFQDNRGIALDSSNNIFVVDGTRNKCIKFNSAGTYQSEFSTGTTPSGVDIDSSNNIYVGIAAHAVEKYNSSGTLQTTYDSITTMGVVWDVAVTADGATIYVGTTAIGVGTPAKIVTSGPTYSNIGTLGTGSSQFQAPTGVAVDGLGNHYYSDSTRNKVIKYDSTGTFVLEFGTTGTNPGEFQNPYGIHAETSGNLLVVDNSRGKLIRFVASVTASITTSSNLYSAGPLPGKLRTVYGMAVVANKIFLVSSVHNKLSRFSSALAFEAEVFIGPNSYPACADGAGNILVGVAGPGVTKYDTSLSVVTANLVIAGYALNCMCVDSSNNIYIGNYYGFVYKYSSAGVLIDTFTIPDPRQIIITNAGYLCVVSRLTVSLYSATSGALVVTATLPSGLAAIGGGVCLQPVTNNILVLNDSNNTMYVYADTSLTLIQRILNIGSGFPISGGHLAADSTYAYMVSQNTTSVYLKRITLAPSGSSTYSFLMEIPDTTSSTISAPTDIVINSADMYITDSSNNRVLRYLKADGTYVSTFGSAGSGNGQFSTPKGIAKDSSGNLFVVDSGNHRVQKFNSSGTYQSQFGANGSGDGQFSGPNRIFIDADDYIYVTDPGNHRVQVFDSAGTFVRKFGSSGSSNGKLSSPVGVAKNPVTGHVYVTNTGNHRIEAFKEFDSTHTKYQSRWGASGSSSTAREFSSPEGVDVDANGHLWVVDTGNHRIQRISSHGRQNLVYGSSGSADGNFSSPSGVYVDDTDLYVVDRGNNRIHKFVILESSRIDTDVETQFKHYLTKGADDVRETTMGFPDRGKHVPNLDAFDMGIPATELDGSYPMYEIPRYLQDMKKSIERLAASKAFTNPDDGSYYDWTENSTSLYKAALAGKHEAFGVTDAVGVTKRTWTEGALNHGQTLDIHIGELYHTVSRLKKAAWGVIEADDE